MGKLYKSQTKLLYKYAEGTELPTDTRYEELPDWLVEELEDLHMYENMEADVERWLDECAELQEEGNF